MRYVTFFGKLFAPFELLPKTFVLPERFKLFRNCDFIYTNNLVFSATLQGNLKSINKSLQTYKKMFNYFFLNLDIIMKRCRDRTTIFCTKEFVFEKRKKKQGQCRELEGKTFYLVWIIANFTDIFEIFTALSFNKPKGKPKTALLDGPLS